GKQTAHTLVYETAMQAYEAGRPLKEAILENESIRAHLSAEEIEGLFDYQKATGLCREFVDRVLALAEKERPRKD
ncbi:MAG: adenylosuccinate lyase, partial [Anaerolineales bacterium]